MSILIPVKKGLEEPIQAVGHKGLLFSHLEESMKLPFSLIISGKVFEEFLAENGLTTKFREREHNIKLKEEMISLFKDATHEIMSGQFPTHTIEDLRECFELASLDTYNPNQKKLEILAIRRSTDYVDEDDHIPSAKYTKNEFDEFLRAIKTCFASLYSPSSVSQRLKQNIDSFSCAIIVSRIPNMETCFESDFSYHQNTIRVNSYVGFLDPTKTVPRDSFILSSEFLKVVHSTILRQDIVSVFDVLTNSIKQQKFVFHGSSQSATEQLVLEIGRLTKKISSQMSVGASLKSEFLLDKNNQIIFLDALFKQATGEEKPNPIVSQPKIQKEEFFDAKPETTLDISIKDNFSNDETITFVDSLKSFLKANKHKSKFGPSIDIVLRALENEVNKDTLLQAVVVAREIIDCWD
ncbi:hypothetical protein JXA48_01405 [Candidatus Woesearchaeota archaeon]|nr:hypothetical protein [Candidatus Woesearchaeota archaeon]